jgi:hypothetical protein
MTTEVEIKLSADGQKIVKYLEEHGRTYRSQIRDDLGIPEARFRKALLSLSGEHSLIDCYRSRGKWDEPEIDLSPGALATKRYREAQEKGLFW